MLSEWWDAAVQALRARAFVPVHELSAAVEHVAQVFTPPVLHSPWVMRFRAWAAAQAGNVTSLAELVRVIAVAPEGHYIAAPLQEALLTLLVGPAAVATSARSRACEPGRSRYHHNRPLLTLPRQRLCAGKVMSRLMTLLRPQLCVSRVMRRFFRPQHLPPPPHHKPSTQLPLMGHIHRARTGSLLQISLGPPLHAS
ncbi:NSF, partial [Symbiodinium necroappetens]